MHMVLLYSLLLLFDYKIMAANNNHLPKVDKGGHW